MLCNAFFLCRVLASVRMCVCVCSCVREHSVCAHKFYFADDNTIWFCISDRCVRMAIESHVRSYLNEHRNGNSTNNNHTPITSTTTKNKRQLAELHAMIFVASRALRMRMIKYFDPEWYLNKFQSRNIEKVFHIVAKTIETNSIPVFFSDNFQFQVRFVACSFAHARARSSTISNCRVNCGVLI